MVLKVSPNTTNKGKLLLIVYLNSNVCKTQKNREYFKVVFLEGMRIVCQIAHQSFK